MNGNRSIVYREFVGVTPVAKTLRNELRPVGHTQEHIIQNGLIQEDELRQEKSTELKNIMDDYYREYIDKSLSGVTDLDFTLLFELMNLVQSSPSKDNKKALEKEQSKMREQICTHLQSDSNYKNIFNAKLFKEILPDFIKNYNQYDVKDKAGKLETVALFNGFSTYFTDFFEKRKNVFTKEAVSTSIAYRIVHENSLIFLANMTSYKKISEKALDEIEVIEKNNQDKMGDWELNQIFNPDFYNMVLIQSGIDFYNEICGVVNAHMNLYCQQTRNNYNLFKMRKLHKQILAYTSTSFEVPKMFEDDMSVYNAVNAFIDETEKGNIIVKLKDIVNKYDELDEKRIYISKDFYETLSCFISGNWNLITGCVENFYDENIHAKGKSKEEKVKKAVKEDKYKSINDVNDLVEKYIDEKERNEFKNSNAKQYIREISNIITDTETAHLEYDEHISLIESEEKADEMKKRLDMYMNMYHWAKAFIVDEVLDRDEMFYSDIDDIYNILENIVPLYNRVRNYVTQKPYNSKKIKLNFQSPTLANGWSQSKEFDNNAIILIRDNKYYLAIFNAKNKPDKKIIQGNSDKKNDNDYKKMVYNLLPGANKMLPKVFLSKKGIETFKPSDYIISGYNAHKHIKTSENFDISFCRDLIDYFKNSIEKHAEWRKYEFKFSATDSYNDISEFYREVEMQGYRIDWTYISEADINKLDEEGKIYLFQIYNKDFAENSTGKENLHTMYFKNIFSEENLKDIIIKLNGQAELFYRRASVKNPVKHKKDSVLVNKTYKNQLDNGDVVRIPIPDDIYNEIYKMYNGYIKESDLSEAAKEYLDKVEVRTAQKDIVKDYRYTVDKYFIHTPITINYKVTARNNVNDMAVKYIAQNDDIHVIGIDRGERNLIYISVIDSHGNIVKQKSYNILNNYDYKKKLVEKEKTREYARKNWKSIGNIKELKEGYISGVVHEIAMLMVEYNAIIAMEDLNYGFKRGRFKVERQVYQKFESMLINKLNYFASKGKSVDEPGGLLKGYQLTYVPDNIKNLGKQCGVIFYVPAAFTSKIDPSTGFISAFNFKSISTNASRKQFFMQFDEIRYCAEKDMFSFGFDYNNFDTYNITMGKTQWTVYTNGERLQSEFNNARRTGKTKSINLTEKIKLLLKDNEINYADGHDVRIDMEKMDEDKNSEFFAQLLSLYKLTVQMRNSYTEAEEQEKGISYDKIISPVINDEGEFFDSDNYKESDDKECKMPKDADANGAYCIALKGLYEVLKIKSEWTEDGFDRNCLKLPHAEWLDFIQNKRYE